MKLLTEICPSVKQKPKLLSINDGHLANDNSKQCVSTDYNSVLLIIVGFRYYTSYRLHFFIYRKYQDDSLHPNTKQSGQNEVGQMVHEL